MKFVNVIYQEHLFQIGGVETFIYELISKYCKKKDITFIYSSGDSERIKRLRKLCRCIKYEGQQIECNVFIVNYSFDKIINNVKAKKYYQIVHGDYYTQNLRPKLNDKFDKYICVSQTAKDGYIKVSNLPEEKFLISHNPLSIKEYKKCLILGSFTRLTKEKGGDRMVALMKELDRQNINYLWIIYTNGSLNYNSSKIIYKQPKLDLLGEMSLCDYVVQLSDCEADPYTPKEAKSVGCKMIVTPCPSFIENNIIGEKDIVIDFNLSNLEDVVKTIKKRIPTYKSDKYEPHKDIYDTILKDSKSDYKLEFVKIKAIHNFTDTYEERQVKIGDEYETTKERAELIEKAGYGKVIL